MEQTIPFPPGAAAGERAAAATAAAAAKAAAQPKKGVVTVRSLHIRKDHSTSSAEVGGLVKGNEVTFTEPGRTARTPG